MNELDYSLEAGKQQKIENLVGECEMKAKKCPQYLWSAAG